MENRLLEPTGLAANAIVLPSGDQASCVTNSIPGRPISFRFTPVTASAGKIASATTAAAPDVRAYAIVDPSGAQVGEASLRHSGGPHGSSSCCAEPCAV